MELVIKDTQINAENMQPILDELIHLLHKNKQSFMCKEYINLKIKTDDECRYYQISIKEIINIHI